VIHHVELSLFPNWSGVDQERLFQVTGDPLTLRTRPLLLEGPSKARGWSGSGCEPDSIGCRWRLRGRPEPLAQLWPSNRVATGHFLSTRPRFQPQVRSLVSCSGEAGALTGLPTLPAHLKSLSDRVRLVVLDATPGTPPSKGNGLSGADASQIAIGDRGGCLRCKIKLIPFQSLEAANKWLYSHPRKPATSRTSEVTPLHLGL
jgi:Lipocalin-like domain